MAKHPVTVRQMTPQERLRNDAYRLALAMSDMDPSRIIISRDGTFVVANSGKDAVYLTGRHGSDLADDDFMKGDS